MKAVAMLLMAAATLGVAHAEETTFVASGRVTWAPDPTLQGIFTKPVSVGDPVRIFYTFESTTPAWYMSAFHAEYQANKEFQVEVAGNVWTLVPCSSCNDNNRIIVEDDYYDADADAPYRYHDVYQSVGSLTRPDGGWSMIVLNFSRFQDSAPVPPLNSLALPLLPPDPADFTDTITFLMNCCDSNGNAVQIDVAISALELDSATPVKRKVKRKAF